mmetsp:Transcript_43149/g.99424  ORF Transcript_43149/g.99424 Transcript_43149/m.99424 type:complete len:387 (+) Transcript_43149:72-1232(+)
MRGRALKQRKLARLQRCRELQFLARRRKMARMAKQSLDADFWKPTASSSSSLVPAPLQDSPKASVSRLPGNFVPEACVGCTIVHSTHPRILGTQPVSPNSQPFEWEAEDRVFIVSNPSRCRSSFAYLTFSGVQVLDRNGEQFPTGVNRAEDGSVELVSTFVVVVPPSTALRLARITQSPFRFYALPLEQLPDPHDGWPYNSLSPGGNPHTLAFPLPSSQGPYLCTQGFGGHLTHFFPQSFHAIDLRCSCRTPILSVGPGVVREVTERHCCGGIHVSNLEHWNAVSVQLDSGLIVEFLHTLPGSSMVKVGERVHTGQALCLSGDIGFAPEPHVHIEVHRATDPEGPSVPICFACSDGDVQSTGDGFVPIAGSWYSPKGAVQDQPVRH